MNANKNRSSAFRLLKHGAVVVVVALCALVLVQVVLAYSYGTFDFPNYRVSVEGPDPNAVPPEVPQVWVYHVEVISTTTLPGLSHNSLGIDPRCQFLSQSSDGDYSFKTEESEKEGTYNGEVVKWELQNDDTELKEPGDTHTFTITVFGQTSTGTTYMAFKAGKTVFDEGYVIGPICETTAVNLTDLEARSSNPSKLMLLGLVLAATISASAALRQLPKGE